ncbi:MAG TPA: HAMP domain-containing sensor histidine kinase, partial [Clostridia bacterium]|nr:HAMP domain-containing sensor histidine kinase [Clostridia bacterium]
YTKDYNNALINESLATLVETTEIAEKVIYSLLDFSSPGKEDYGQVNITKIVEQIVLLMRRNSIYKNIVIETKFVPNQLIYYGEAEPLKHIFLNLISNAMNVLEPKGEILIRGYYEKIGNEDKLILIVKDNGPGMTEEVITKVFEPFYTTDITGKGHGMGLWITKIMVEKMHGSIILESKKGKGAEFIITIPENRDNRRTL